MIYPSDDFARSTPEAQGIRSQAISDMLTDIRLTGGDIHAMLIMRHGYLVFEQYFAPYTEKTQHAMYSCSKTFTSMLIGVAQEKGLLKLSDRVVSYFPDYELPKNEGYLSEMTIENLLVMGSGHPQDTFAAMEDTLTVPNADWVSIFLNRPVTEKPGTHFVYNTGATYMLSAILTKVTGKTALELAEEWLFEPMGIKGARWDTCPKGISMGGTGLYITPRDMLRMGIMLMSHGRWQDKQLVPPSYVYQASHKHIENRTGDPDQNPNWANGYGYQMWRCAFDAFRADGMGGQFIVCIPGLDMIGVFTCALGFEISTGYPLKLIEKYLLKNTFDAPQVSDVDAADELRRLSEAAAHPKAQPAPDAFLLPYDAVLKLDDNSYGWRSITVGRDEIIIDRDCGTLTVPYSFGAPKLSDDRCYTGFRTQMARVSGEAVQNNDSLKLIIRFQGEPLTYYVSLTPRDEAHDVVIKSTLWPTDTTKGHPA